MAVLETIFGGALGTLAGMIEKPLAQYMDLKAKKLDNEHVEKMQSLQFEHDKLMAEKELFGEGIKADTAILTASYAHDSAFGETSKWVNNICKLVRPASLPMTAGMAIYNIEFMPAFMLALTWWFASRVRSSYPD